MDTCTEKRQLNIAGIIIACIFCTITILLGCLLVVTTAKEDVPLDEADNVFIMNTFDSFIDNALSQAEE